MIYYSSTNVLLSTCIAHCTILPQSASALHTKQRVKQEWIFTPVPSHPHKNIPVLSHPIPMLCFPHIMHRPGGCNQPASSHQSRQNRIKKAPEQLALCSKLKKKSCPTAVTLRVLISSPSLQESYRNPVTHRTQKKCQPLIPSEQ